MRGGVVRPGRLELLRERSRQSRVKGEPVRGRAAGLAAGVVLAPDSRAYVNLGPELMLLDGPFYAYVAQRFQDPPEKVPSLERVQRERMAERLHDHMIEHYIDLTRPKLQGSTQVPYADRWHYIAPVRGRVVGSVP